MRKWYLIVCAAICLLVLLAGCGGGSSGDGGGDAAGAAETADATGAADVSETADVNAAAGGGNVIAEDAAGDAAEGDHPMVEIVMADGGTITVELDRAAAPITVDNFLKLVNDGFYDGLTFHRVIDGFMIQGGDPLGTGTGGSDEKIVGEFSQNGWENPISHERGVISMARSQSKDSASCQFFITNGDATYLDGQYAAFGRVTGGMEVVDAIAKVDKDANDKPLEPVVIETIRVVG
ncbi:MAG: peptidylprolyl isomerase [Clostridiales Family XIII bacterium]|jgi:peptidyl-prolyl cis-trans isomerase B (cyclophilin B)|nr:peptidylprolyl isomerase [Clostridiales Family XIII bacterium]